MPTGIGDRGEVVTRHDLADAGTKGLREHRHVESAAQQDDPDVRTFYPGDLRERAGRVDVDVRTDDDQLLRLVALEHPERQRGALHRLQRLTDRHRVALGGAGVVVPENRHRVP